MVQKDIVEQLEAMVDKHGLLHVLTGLECVCREKADHLRVNWQDETTARFWAKDAKTIEAILPKLWDISHQRKS